MGEDQGAYPVVPPPDELDDDELDDDELDDEELDDEELEVVGSGQLWPSASFVSQNLCATLHPSACILGTAMREINAIVTA